MKINELSDEELSRLLAEHFEPKPAEQGGYYDSTSCSNRIANGTNNRRYDGSSKLKWWIWRDDWRTDNTVPINNGTWQPRPFTDPEIVVRLLKCLRLCVTRDGSTGFVCYGVDELKHIEAHAETLERAIAEAALLATGWKEKA